MVPCQPYAHCRRHIPSFGPWRVQYQGGGTERGFTSSERYVVAAVAPDAANVAVAHSGSVTDSVGRSHQHPQWSAVRLDSESLP